MRVIGFLILVVLDLGLLVPRDSMAQDPKGPAPEDPVYLFSTFREPEQDGLRFAYSTDAHHWSNLPGLFLEPRVGGGILRDPSVCRGPDGRWHVVWTSAWRGDRGFGYAQSRDLVHWSDPRFIPVMEHEPDTVNVWAPELFYDAPRNRFIIVWASTIPGRFPDHLEPRTNNHRLYYTTTKDFQEFTPTQLFWDPGYSVIDAQIVFVDPGYVLVHKDNTRPERRLRVAFGQSPLGPWRDISPPLTAPFTEGPSVLKVGAEWIVYYEAYRDRQYRALKTRDFRSFRDATSEMTFPPGLKHGTAFVATRRDLERLLQAGARKGEPTPTRR
ncbi:glycoside hydrolase family 43 protein [Limisphaera sp. VF-2]|jgi:hypothetical protein|uniref:glycoside hydrolase family 43 protein n=1 Tax=Limisphaera sp. VF-2 TaxID=3400418 RepID=UPI0025634DB1|nr:glycoside hydrolase family 43 protein [Limisphaera sp.]